VSAQAISDAAQRRIDYVREKAQKGRIVIFTDPNNYHERDALYREFRGLILEGRVSIPVMEDVTDLESFVDSYVEQMKDEKTQLDTESLYVVNAEDGVSRTEPDLLSRALLEATPLNKILVVSKDALAASNRFKTIQMTLSDSITTFWEAQRKILESA